MNGKWWTIPAWRRRRLGRRAAASRVHNLHSTIYRLQSSGSAGHGHSRTGHHAHAAREEKNRKLNKLLAESMLATFNIEMPMTILCVSAILVMALDQATKAFILSNHREGQVTSFAGVAIRRITNRGAPTRFLSGRTTLLTLWIAELAVLLLLVHVGPLFQHVVARVGLGLAIGGAGGNVFDRLWRGNVVDFVDLRFWPVFNLADTAIVTGALLAIVFMR
jgi:signal peptidase II